MIQVIDYKDKSFTIVIDGVDCWFKPKPISLTVAKNFKLIKPFVTKQKALLYWKVGKVRVSYWQIKEAVIKYQSTN